MEGVPGLVGSERLGDQEGGSVRVVGPVIPKELRKIVGSYEANGNASLRGHVEGVWIVECFVVDLHVATVASGASSRQEVSLDFFLSSA